MRIMMKINPFLLLFIVMLPLLTSSQVLLPGVKIGANISNLRAKNNDLFSSDIKACISVYLNYPISKHVFFYPEIQYSRQGFYNEDYDYITTHPYPNTTYTRSYVKMDSYFLNYLKAPVCIGIKPFKSDFNIKFGFYAAYLMKAFIKTNDDLMNSTINIGSETYAVDYGLSAGVRSELKNGFNYGIDIDYGIGRVIIDNSLKTTNMNYMLSMGYTLWKKKYNLTGEPK